MRFKNVYKYVIWYYDYIMFMNAICNDETISQKHGNLCIIIYKMYSRLDSWIGSRYSYLINVFIKQTSPCPSHSEAEQHSMIKIKALKEKEHLTFCIASFLDCILSGVGTAWVVWPRDSDLNLYTSETPRYCTIGYYVIKRTYVIIFEHNRLAIFKVQYKFI